MSALVEAIGEDFTLTGSGRYLKTFEHDSFVIDTERDIFFWNSKGIVGDLFTYLTKIRGMSVKEAYIAKIEDRNDLLKSYDIVEEKNKNSIVVYPELVDIFYEYGRNNRQLWYNRGYTDKTIDKFKLGFEGKWYVIPIFEESKFVNFQMRMENPRMMSTWYKISDGHTFNFSMLPVTDFVILTEGPVDAIMLSQYGIPAVSQTAGSGNIDIYRKHFNKFNNIQKIYICYDNDKAGQSGSLKVARLFGNKARVYNFWDFDEKYDVGDFFKEGNTKDAFISLVEEKGKAWYEL